MIPKGRGRGENPPEAVPVRARARGLEAMTTGGFSTEGPCTVVATGFGLSLAFQAQLLAHAHPSPCPNQSRERE